MSDWILTDLKRLARQLYRHVKAHPRVLGGVGGVAALVLVFAFATRTWALLAALGLVALFAWGVSAPTRHLMRLRLRVALRSAGLDPPPRVTRSWLGGVLRTPYGARTTLTLREGQSVEQLERARPTVVASLDVMRVDLERHTEAGGHVALDVVERLPWDPDEILPWPLQGAAEVSLWDEIPIALDMHLTEITWRMLVPDVGGQCVLAGGVPGAGKSRFFDLLIAAGVLDPTCTVVLLDGKEADMWAWHPAAHIYVGFDMDEAVAALSWLDDWITTRLRAMKTEAWVDVHGVEHTGKRWAHPGDPTVLVACDEYATYTASLNEGLAKQFNDLMARIVQRGRAAGVIAVLSAQKAAADVIPTGIRDLLTWRAGFRATTKEASDMALGKGWATAGYSSTEIPIPYRGVAWLTQMSERPSMGKTFALPDEQRHAIAERGRVHPPESDAAPDLEPLVPEPVHAGNGAPRRSPLG